MNPYHEDRPESDQRIPPVSWRSSSEGEIGDESSDFEDQDQDVYDFGLIDFNLRSSAAMMEALDFRSPETPFSYTPLQQDEIRIVQLMVKGWVRNEGQDEINCILVNVQPRTIPSYECLSYCWGAHDDASPSIYCNRRTFKINNELYDALKCMQADSEGPRYLWIDQLCINQNDADEKSKQVQRMASIYQNAARVLLFPGRNPLFKRAIDTIADFQDYHASGDEDDDDWFKHQWQRSSVEDLEREFDLPPPEDESWEAVRELLSAPCFRRTWIVQEIALAKPKDIRPVIDEKEHIFDSSGFIGFLIMQKNRSISSARGRYVGNEIDAPMRMMRIRLAYLASTAHVSLDLLSLLDETRSYGITDPRDKIYGLLSIARDREQLNILPDYSASLIDCYVEAARRITEVSGTLDVLLYKETSPRRIDLPSWAPDWSQTLREQFGTYRTTANPLYNASGDLKLQIRGIGGMNKLQVHGIRIDGIYSLTPGVADDRLKGIFEVVFGHGTWYRQALSTIGPVYHHTRQHIAQALGHTRVAGDHNESRNARGSAMPLMAPKFYEVREDELRQGGYEDDQDNRDFMRLIGTVATVTLYRSFFTSGKKYMGLVPMTSQLGDEIFVLPGCNEPVVLRHMEGGGYELIGRCYCHGIMNGEAADAEELRGVTLM